jgi:hypothetical protein
MPCLTGERRLIPHRTYAYKGHVALFCEGRWQVCSSQSPLLQSRSPRRLIGRRVWINAGLGLRRGVRGSAVKPVITCILHEEQFV